jgi:hypothetical protein
MSLGNAMAINPYQAPGYASSEAARQPLDDVEDDKLRRKDLTLEAKFISMGLGFLIFGGYVVVHRLWSFRTLNILWLFSHNELFFWAMALWVPGGLLVMRFQRIGLFVLFSACVYIGLDGVRYVMLHFQNNVIPHDFPNFEIDVITLFWPLILLRMIP